MAKILVVDDEKDVLEFWMSILKREGFEVLVAPNGKECLELATNNHPDLILLDINMPDMDGGDIEKCLSLDTKTKDIPVIFLSGLLTKDEERHIRGRLYISKSNSQAEILVKIRKVLGAAS